MKVLFHIRPSPEERYLKIREDNISENQDLRKQDSSTSTALQLTQDETQNKKTKKTKSPTKTNPALTTEPGNRKTKPVPTAGSRNRPITTTESGLLNGDQS